MSKTFVRWVSGLAAVWLVFAPASARAQNQQEMNRQAEQDFQKADAALNKVYKELSGNMSKEDLEELKTAQRLWVQFRDAQAKFEADLGARGGSLYPTIYEGRRAALTKARTEELKRVRSGNN